MEVPAGEPEAAGEEAPEEYSSYFHLDVKDKWVLMFRYLPDGIDQDTRTRYSRHASLRYKALEARKRGAMTAVSNDTTEFVYTQTPVQRLRN